MTVSPFGKSAPASPALVPEPRKRLSRRTRIVLWIVGIIFLLMLLLGFNPLHPIWSFQEFGRSFAAGWHDAGVAKARMRAQKLAQEQAQEQAQASAARAHHSVAPAQ